MSISHQFVAAAWLDAARRVARASRDPEALEVYAFLEGRAVFAWTQLDIVHTLTPRKRKEVVIVPILKADHESVLGSRLKKFDIPAEYHQNQHTLVLDGDLRLHPILSGIILLHEGFHAFSADRDPSLCGTTNTEIGYRHEADTIKFQNRILRTVLGPAYVARRNQLTADLRQVLRQANLGLADRILSSDPKTDAEMIKIYGSPQNAYELNLMTDLILRDAHFELIERDAPSEAHHLQAQLLRLVGTSKAR